MNPADIRIGFVPIARPTFDLELAREMTAQVYSEVTQAGYNIVGEQDLVMDAEAVDARIDQLASADIDMLLMLQSSFADSTMVMQLARALSAPLLMWALPEEQVGGTSAHQFFLRHQSGGSRFATGGQGIRLHLRRAK